MKFEAILFDCDGVLVDSEAITNGVLFDAALNGFPKPPQGPRQVRIPLAPPAP